MAAGLVKAPCGCYWLRILLPRMKPKIPVRMMPIVVWMTFSMSTSGDTSRRMSESMPAMFLRLTPRAWPYSRMDTFDVKAQAKMKTVTT